LIDSGQGQAADSCECGDEPLDFIKCGAQHLHYWVLRNTKKKALNLHFYLISHHDITSKWIRIISRELLLLL